MLAKTCQSVRKRLLQCSLQKIDYGGDLFVVQSITRQVISFFIFYL